MNVRKIITLTFVLASIALTVGLSGCEKITSMVHDAETPHMDETPSMMDKEIPIGLVVSLTEKDAEPYGLPMQRGFELAREEIIVKPKNKLTYSEMSATF